MGLPFGSARLAGITDFPTWRSAVERAVSDLDSRLASRGSTAARSMRAAPTAPTEPVTSGEAGYVCIWLGTTVPSGTLPVIGQLLEQADYPYLYAAVGDQHQQGHDPAGTFRLPDLGAPPAGMYVVRT